MRKTIIIFCDLLISAGLYAQQFPSMEGSSINTFNLSPAYTGLNYTKTLFIDYRSDWAGIAGGPLTCQLSYNDKITEKIGLGGRFIYDKTDIFKQTLVLVTYAYEVHIAGDHYVNFALSSGFYRNSIDLEKYYNDPTYVQDNALIYGRNKSKIKFATDISALYRFKQLETGILLSNIMFGTVRYRFTDMTYKPLKNYVLHASYNFTLDESWSAKPIFILRGGQNIPLQAEISSTVTWKRSLWGIIVFKTGGIFGLGFGGEVYKGIIINYSRDISNNVLMNTFSSNQLSLGINLFHILKKQSHDNI